MSWKFHFTKSSLIGESRRCHFSGEPEDAQQLEDVSSPEKQEVHKSPQLRAESLQADIEHNAREEVGKAAKGVECLHEKMTTADKRLRTLKESVTGEEATHSLATEQRANIEKITSSLAPIQQQIIREASGDLDVSHQDALVTFVQKLTPGMCNRLQKRIPISSDDVRLIGTILPKLNQQEMDLFMAMRQFALGNAMTEEQSRFIDKAMPIGVEQRQHQQDEKRESAEVSRESRGFITDAADNLMKQNGFLRPGQGIDKIENRLALTGNPKVFNYSAVGSTLFIEAIDADGTAQKFAVPMGNGFENQLTLMRYQMLEGGERTAPIATYKTAKIASFYKRSPDHFSVAHYSIKVGGNVPRLLMDADKNNIVIETTRNNIESDLVAKKDGKIISKTTESINDRERWEHGIATMLEEALRNVKTT